MIDDRQAFRRATVARHPGGFIGRKRTSSSAVHDLSAKISRNRVRFLILRLEQRRRHDRALLKVDELPRDTKPLALNGKGGIVGCRIVLQAHVRRTGDDVHCGGKLDVVLLDQCFSEFAKLGMLQGHGVPADLGRHVLTAVKPRGHFEGAAAWPVDPPRSVYLAVTVIAPVRSSVPVNSTVPSPLKRDPVVMSRTNSGMSCA